MREIPDLEGHFIAENHQRSGRELAARMLRADGLAVGASVTVRRTGVTVARRGTVLDVIPSGAVSPLRVGARTGDPEAYDMLAHARGELGRGLRRAAGRAVSVEV
jgi:hypothetical protein